MEDQSSNKIIKETVTLSELKNCQEPLKIWPNILGKVLNLVCNMLVQKLRQSREVVTHGEEKINQKDEFSLYIKNKKQGLLLRHFLPFNLF